MLVRKWPWPGLAHERLRGRSVNFWRQVFTITWKDVRSEFRAREIITSVLVFTLLVIVIFNFEARFRILLSS